MEFNGIIALRVYKLLFWLNNTLQFGLKLPRTLESDMGRRDLQNNVQ